MQSTCAALYFHLWLAGLYYSFEHFSQTAAFSVKIIEHEMCVLNFSPDLFETFLILRRI